MGARKCAILQSRADGMELALYPIMVRLYSGTAQGTRAQVAVDGDRAFARYWISKGRYGWSWSKWAPVAVDFPTVIYSKIEGMEHVAYTVEAGSRVSLGFSDLPLVSTDAKVRLPKPQEGTCRTV